MQQVDTRVVTPEAVVLQFETAGVGSRFLARLVDTLVQGSVLVALSLGLAAAGSGGVGSTPLLIFLLVSTFAIIFVYPAAFETLWRGRTPGKAALGLRVVTREGAPIRFRHAAIRSALWLVDGLLLYASIGFITMLVTRDTVRLGDMAAGTIVVRERTGARMPTAMHFPVPQGCEAYVATLDVSGLNGEDYEAARNLLLRAPSLTPNARWDLARQLGTHVAARMRHTPPSWVSPELFLACVAAAYQQRFAGGPGASPAPAAPDVWGAPRPSPPAAPTPPAGPAGPGDFAPPA
ncbi:MAG: hypothetical protein QOG64_1903 [Acidimicrobiaceae bacterium]|nr:hypothetical protein [Acidimicrobiaceae bacterium]